MSSKVERFIYKGEWSEECKRWLCTYCSYVGSIRSQQCLALNNSILLIKKFCVTKMSTARLKLNVQ